MSPKEKLDELTTCQNILDSASLIDLADIARMTSAIDRALAVPPPGGSPAKIDARIAAYKKATELLNEVTGGLGNVAQNSLPTAWRGGVAETAAQAVMALQELVYWATNCINSAVATGPESYSGSFLPSALQDWSQTLRAVKPLDEAGRAILQKARLAFDSLDASLRRLLHPGGIGGWLEEAGNAMDPAWWAAEGVEAADEFNSAIGEARDGIRQMVSAAGQVYSHQTSDVHKLQSSYPNGSWAYNYGVEPTVASAGPLNALDIAVLAAQVSTSTSVPSPQAASDLFRGLKIVSGMSPAQQAQFEKLLATAKNPAAAAAVMQKVEQK